MAEQTPPLYTPGMRRGWGGGNRCLNVGKNTSNIRILQKFKRREPGERETSEGSAKG